MNEDGRQVLSELSVGQNMTLTPKTAPDKVLISGMMSAWISVFYLRFRQIVFELILVELGGFELVFSGRRTGVLLAVSKTPVYENGV